MHWQECISTVRSFSTLEFKIAPEITACREFLAVRKFLVTAGICLEEFLSTSKLTIYNDNKLGMAHASNSLVSLSICKSTALTTKRLPFGNLETVLSKSLQYSQLSSFQQSTVNLITCRQLTKILSRWLASQTFKSVLSTIFVCASRIGLVEKCLMILEFLSCSIYK